MRRSARSAPPHRCPRLGDPDGNDGCPPHPGRPPAPPVRRLAARRSLRVPTPNRPAAPLGVHRHDGARRQPPSTGAGATPAYPVPRSVRTACRTGGGIRAPTPGSVLPQWLLRLWRNLQGVVDQRRVRNRRADRQVREEIPGQSGRVGVHAHAAAPPQSLRSAVPVQSRLVHVGCSPVATPCAPECTPTATPKERQGTLLSEISEPGTDERWL